VGWILRALDDDGWKLRRVGRPAANRMNGTSDGLVDDGRRRLRRRRDQGCVPSVTWSDWLFPPREMVTLTLVPGAY
jgi:hypothetical protein